MLPQLGGRLADAEAEERQRDLGEDVLRDEHAGLRQHEAEVCGRMWRRSRYGAPAPKPRAAST